jgi:hypothetical protein
MNTPSDLARPTRTEGLLPGGIRAAVFAAVGLALAGALFLVAMRGEALLLDLAAFSQRMFCF